MQFFDTDAYIDFLQQFIQEGTVECAAFVLEPAQGWGRVYFTPEDFFPNFKQLM